MVERAIMAILRKGCSRDTRGLSLVELLCAITLLSFLLLPVFQLLLNASAGMVRSEHRLRALLLGQRMLEEAVLLGPEDAENLPEADIDRFHLRLQVTPFRGADDIHDLTVSVSWREGSSLSKKEIRLRTLLCGMNL